SDPLRGFKENVIMGHLIPAGSGYPIYRNMKLVPLAEPISIEDMLGDRIPTEEDEESDATETNELRSENELL
ncbi:MAG: hypothetical protein U1E27_13995, partial [Kiritimatiellia bacterium]|nr:hypothetical protein [Kiritimatiellia bacterium]